LALEDSTVWSKAIWTTMLANPFDMNVSTFGSVAEVVTPPERVVDASAVEARNVSFEVSEISAEQVDIPLGLAAVLAGQHAARRNAGKVEVECVRSDRREQLVVEPDGVEVLDPLVARPSMAGKPAAGTSSRRSE
jgi:hypothetical protein